MPKKTHGLGRGLDSLFAGTEDWGTSIQEIPVGELDPNPDQPRRTFSAESISQLADSIREQGVLQPLLVAPAGGGRYMIIAGERRYRAGREAGLETLPCIVKDIDVIRQREIALIENLQREDLNPIEAAKGIRALMDQCGYTQEKVSARLGKSRPAVANMLRLLQLPDAEQLRLSRKAVEEGLNVRQMEQLVKSSAGTKPKKRSVPKRLPAELEELQEKIRMRTGLKSALTGSVSKGRIVLQYSSREELEQLNELLDRIGE